MEVLDDAALVSGPTGSPELRTVPALTGDFQPHCITSDTYDLYREMSRIGAGAGSRADQLIDRHVERAREPAEQAERSGLLSVFNLRQILL